MSRLLATCYEHFFPIAIHAFHVSALDVRDRVECARVEKKTNANSSMRTNQKSLRTLNTMVHYSFRYKLARQRFVAAICYTISVCATINIDILLMGQRQKKNSIDNIYLLAVVILL